MLGVEIVRKLINNKNVQKNNRNRNIINDYTAGKKNKKGRETTGKSES